MIAKEIVLRGFGGQGCTARIQRRGREGPFHDTVFVGWITEAGLGGPYLELEEVRRLLREMEGLEVEI